MNEVYLRVFTNKSELVLSDGTVQIFPEGVMSPSAKLRYQKITTELANHYLEQQIFLCRDQASSLDFSQLNQDHVELFHKLVDSITSEVGRALVGLTVLQYYPKRPQKQFFQHHYLSQAGLMQELRGL